MEPTPQTILWAILALFGKEIVSYFISKSKDNSKALTENTEALIALKIEMKHIRELTSDIPRIQKDLNQLHSKIRDITK